MTWDGVLKIIMATLASVGGISAVIVLAVKYSADFIAKRLEEVREYISGLDILE